MLFAWLICDLIKVSGLEFFSLDSSDCELMIFFQLVGNFLNSRRILSILRFHLHCFFCFLYFTIFILNAIYHLNLRWNRGSIDQQGCNEEWEFHKRQPARIRMSSQSTGNSFHWAFSGISGEAFRSSTFIHTNRHFRFLASPTRLNHTQHFCLLLDGSLHISTQSGRSPRKRGIFLLLLLNHILLPDGTLVASKSSTKPSWPNPLLVRPCSSLPLPTLVRSSNAGTAATVRCWMVLMRLTGLRTALVDLRGCGSHRSWFASGSDSSKLQSQMLRRALKLAKSEII